MLDPAPPRHADADRFERAARGERDDRRARSRRRRVALVGRVARPASATSSSGDRRRRSARSRRDRAHGALGADVLAHLPFERRGSKLYRPVRDRVSAGARPRRPPSRPSSMAAAPGAARVADAELARFLEQAARLVRLGDGYAVSAAAYARARASSSRSAGRQAGSRSPASATSPAAAAATRSSCSSGSTPTASLAGSETRACSGVPRHARPEVSGSPVRLAAIYDCGYEQRPDVPVHTRRNGRPN